MTKVIDVVQFLEVLAPSSFQESYDNSGLLVGDGQMEVTKILISLDCTEHIVEEAIEKGCNLIIAHHPIIFKGLKKITPRSYVERTVIRAIKKDIALVAIHTNLDNVTQGVSFKIAEVLDLKDVKILETKKGLLQKLITFIPVEHTEAVLNSLFKAGAGNIGNYQNCSFRLNGKGSFLPSEKANPFIGEVGKTEYVSEDRVEVVFPTHLNQSIVKELIKAHPYETPAYDIIPLENEHIDVGAGALGQLKKGMKEEEFLHYLKDKMNLKCIRHTSLTGKEVNKVALCGGAGSFLLSRALRENADVFITGDFKYHDFFDAEGKILVADIGHYESEVFTKELIFDFLKEKFCNIAILLTNINTNPVQYFI